MSSNNYIINVARFLLLILAQIFIFNKINLGGYVNPMIYPLFIILLPFETNKILSLFIAFFLGITVDLFTGSIGLHASATVFMAFMRPFAMQFISSKKEYEAGVKPGINDLGYKWFISFTFFLISAHHIFFFMIEAFSFYHFGQTILRILLSIMLSTIMILLLDVVFKSQKVK